MSFLKITDPDKRDFLVQELINTRKAIRQDSIKERLGDTKLYQDSTKLFKPLSEKIESSSRTLEPIVSTIKTLPSTISESIKAITFPQYPSIEATEAGPEGVSLEAGPEVGTDRRSPQAAAQQPLMELGEIATAYLKRFAEKKNTTDKVFGIHDREGKFHIGNTEVILDGDNITLMSTGKTYTGTPGLWAVAY